MAEEKREKKKHGLVKRIFKWIGLSILILLILLALVVEAPKKLVILLLITENLGTPYLFLPPSILRFIHH